MANDTILELKGVTKRFSGVDALTNVDLNLRSGEILALLGENGAGKTTLMNVLAGVHRPDEGRILFERREVQFSGPHAAQQLGISIIHQEFSLIPDLTAYENILFGREIRTRFGTLDRAAMKKAAKSVLGQLGIQLDLATPVIQLSIGAQQFVEIGKALARASRILILDEPTATLTSDEVDRLFDLMRELRRRGMAMVFISHHLDEIFKVADRVQCLRDGRSVCTKPISACAPSELVKMIAGRDIAHAYPPRRDAEPGRVILVVNTLRRARNLPSVSFALREGEILGFAGLVGSGRTEAMRALIGADRVHDRDILFQGRPFTPHCPADARALGIGLIPENRKQQGLILPFSLSDNVVLANLRNLCHSFGGWLRRDRQESATVRLVKRLLIKASSTRQPVHQLSGGNQQKVVVAKWLFADCQILIFDEPTRGIDVGAKSEVYALMRELTAQGMSIIMISSELPEIVGMSDRVIVMRQHRVEATIERAEEITAERIMHYATGSHLT